MAQRNVVVKIKAEYAQFRRDMDQVSKAAKDAARDTEDSGKRASTALGRLSQDATKNREAWDTAGTAAVGFGLVAVAAVGLAISKYAQFEKAMSRVQAATHESTANMDLLREAALQAGADTAFSAEEAAGAIEELAKAGVSTADILGGGLNGALSLAAAGELAVADAAEIAASAMVQFKLSGEDIPHIADLLAAGAGKAQGSVADMGAALNQVGLVASATGLDIEETTGSLAAFASAGLTGSDAGTSFKAMLQRLNPSSKEAAEKMAELGINAYDAQGNFKGMEALAGNLSTAMADLSEQERAAAMNIIFGADAVRAANVLYEQGAEGVAKWTDAVDTAGFAALTASINQDNLLGDLEKLGGAFDTVFLKSGGAANEAMRGLVQAVEGLVDGIGKLPVPVLETGLAIAGIAGSTGLALGGILKLTPAVLDGVTAFRSLGTEGGKVPGTLGKIAKGATIAAVAIGALQIVGKIITTQDAKTTEEYGNAILKVAEAGEKAKASDLDAVFNGGWQSTLGDSTVNVNGMANAIERMANPHWGDGLMKWADDTFGWIGIQGSEITQLEDRMAEFGDELGNLASNGGAEAAAQSFNLLSEEFRQNGKSAQDALDAMPGYRDALDGIGQAAGVALNPTELLELATGKIPDRMVAAQEATALAEAQFGTYADAAGQAVPITEAQAEALAEVGVAADGTIASLSAYVEALFAAGLSEMSAREATAAHQQALDANAGAIEAATKALEDQLVMEGMGVEASAALAAETVALGGALNGAKTDFDLTNAAGRALNDQFQNVASTGMAEIEAKAKAGIGQDELQANLGQTYDSLIHTLDGMGITGGAADDLARRVMGIPDNANISTWMSDQAKRMAEQTIGAVNALDGKHATVTTDYVENTYKRVIDLGSSAPGTMVRPGQVGRHASGGRLPTGGPGTERTDGILGVSHLTGAPISWLDGGEWVINARASEKHHSLLSAVNRDDPRLSSIPGLAGGGRVPREYAAAPSWGGGSGGGSVTAVLAAEDRALLQAVAERPIDNRIMFDGRQVFGWLQTAPSKYRTGGR